MSQSLIATPLPAANLSAPPSRCWEMCWCQKQQHPLLPLSGYPLSASDARRRPIGISFLVFVSGQWHHKQAESSVTGNRELMLNRMVKPFWIFVRIIDHSISRAQEMGSFLRPFFVFWTEWTLDMVKKNSSKKTQNNLLQYNPRE